MPSDHLIGVRIKIGRAKKHLDDLKQAIKLFGERNKYCVLIEIDPETGDEIYRLRVPEGIHPEWGGIVGDCVHNLRSALDLLANALVRQEGGVSNDNASFPIGRDRAKFREYARKQLNGISPAARRLVDRLKPYGGPDGSKALWQLHCLDIIDKHRLLVPVLAMHAETIFMPNLVFSGFGNEPIRFPSLSLKSSDRVTVEDGAILLTYRRGPPDVDKTQFHPIIEISFGKSQVFDGEPIVPTLQQLIDFVERIVDIFERAIFR